MFDNTIALAFNGGTLPLTRVNQDKYASTYRHRDTTFDVDMNVRHTSRKDSLTGKTVDRHNVELQFTNKGATVGDGSLAKETCKVYFVFEGFSTLPQDSAVAYVNALKDTMMSNDMVKRLTIWES